MVKRATRISGTIRKRYRKARKKDKQPILDEFCTNCGYLCPETKDRLIDTFLNTNPFVLKKTIQAKLKIIFNALE